MRGNKFKNYFIQFFNFVSMNKIYAYNYCDFLPTMSKLRELEDQMKVLVKQEHKIFLELQEAKKKRGKLVAKFEAQKDGKQMLIDNCQKSRPPGYNLALSFPHVPEEQDPHAQFMKDKEMLESGYRRDLECLQHSHMVALIAPNAEIRNLEQLESDIQSKIRMLSVKIGCCKPKHLRLVLKPEHSKPVLKLDKPTAKAKPCPKSKKALHSKPCPKSKKN
jgi:hypothetical protein